MNKRTSTQRERVEHFSVRQVICHLLDAVQTIAANMYIVKAISDRKNAMHNAVHMHLRYAHTHTHSGVYGALTRHFYSFFNSTKSIYREFIMHFLCAYAFSIAILFIRVPDARKVVLRTVREMKSSENEYLCS